MLNTTSEVSSLSLHDALPIFHPVPGEERYRLEQFAGACVLPRQGLEDRKSTRLNSSHGSTSYAVFGLKKKMTGVACPLVEHGAVRAPGNVEHQTARAVDKLIA